MSGSIAAIALDFCVVDQLPNEAWWQRLVLQFTGVLGCFALAILAVYWESNGPMYAGPEADGLDVHIDVSSDAGGDDHGHH